MSNIEIPPAITPEIMAELQQAVEDAMKGVRNHETMRRAAEEMDRTREEIYRRIGLVDFAVPTVRALRDDE